MVYFLMREPVDPGFDENYFEVAGVQLGDDILGTMDFLTNPEYFRKVMMAGTPVRLTWLPSMDCPVLTIDSNVENPNNYIQVNDVEKLIRSYINPETGKVPEDILKQIVAKVRSVYPNDGDKRVLVAYTHLAYLATTEIPQAINVGADDLDPDFLIPTSNRLSQHNQQFTTGLHSISASENVTIFQSDCKDNLFIEIPNRNDLLALDDGKLSSTIPPRSAVCVPYSDKNAYSPKYKELGVPKYLIPMIEGNAENNKFEVHENESKYYNALTEWVTSNIRADLNEDAEKLSNGTATIDGLSQEYLTELCDHLYSWHWSHNPHVPQGFNDESEEEYQNSSSDSVSSRYSYNADSVVSGDFSNAIVSLNMFLEEASASLGYSVYTRATVLLARWGERKPTALVFDEYPVIFDLGTGTVKQNIGSISDYKLVENNGFSSYFVGAVYLDGVCADSSVGSFDFKHPVGIIVQSDYAKDSNTIGVPKYYSMFDAIPALKSGELKVDGISWDGSGFKVDDGASATISELISGYNANPDQFLQMPFVRSEEMKDLGIEFAATGGDTKQNIMAIMNDSLKLPDLGSRISKYRMHDLRELNQMVTSGITYSTTSVLDANVAKVTLKVFEKITGTTLSEEFNSWEQNLSDWKGLRSFYEIGATSEATFSVANEATSTATVMPESSNISTSNMSAFGTAPEQQTAPATEQSNNTPTQVSAGPQENTTAQSPVQIPSESVANVHDALVHALPNGIAHSIIDDQGSIIGGYFSEVVVHSNGRKMKRFIIFGVDVWNSLDPEKKAQGSVHVFKLFPFFIDDLAQLAFKQTANIKLLFDSVETIHYFTKLMKTIADRNITETHA